MRRDDQRQAVKNISLEQLKSFKNHPFQVRDDEEFRRLVESIEIHGVIHPAVARQIGEDCYELISGHRRKAACEVLGYGGQEASQSQGATSRLRPAPRGKEKDLYRVPALPGGNAGASGGKG